MACNLTPLKLLSCLPSLQVKTPWGQDSWCPQDHTQHLAFGCYFTDTGKCSKRGLTQLPHGTIQVLWFLQDPRLAVIFPLIQNLTAFPEKTMLLRPFCQGRPVLREAHPTKASSHVWLNSSSGIMHQPRQVKPNALCHLAPMTRCVLSKTPFSVVLLMGVRHHVPAGTLEPPVRLSS